MAAETDGASRIRSVWLLFAAFSLAAVLTGCWAAAANGSPPRAWLVNIGAWAVGAALAAGIARIKADLALGWLVLAVIVLVLTLVSPGLSGVHRWFAIGPVRFNGAELVLPAALAACAGLERGSLLRLLAPLVAVAMLAAQPDRSQAAATAAAALVLLTRSSRPVVLRVLAGFGSAVALALAIVRPDPLGPVPEVEGIVGLAAALSPIVASLGVAAIVGAVLTPLALARAPEFRARAAALSLSTYLAVAALAPVAGAYPVPLMGLGPSPIIGAWLGVGWLMQLARRAVVVR